MRECQNLSVLALFQIRIRETDREARKGGNRRIIMINFTLNSEKTSAYTLNKNNFLTEN